MKKVIHFYIRGKSKYFPKYLSKDYFLFGWSQIVARQVLRHSTEFEMENWRFEGEVDKIETKTFNNVKCRLFPAKKWPILKLFSFKLIKELKKEIEQNYIIMHMYNMHDFRIYLFLFLFRRTPIIIINCGNRPPKFFYKDTKNIKYLFKNFCLLKSVKYIDYYFPTGKDDREYMVSLLESSKISNFAGLGVDYKNIRPIDKVYARNKKNLRVDQKILLYVGTLYRLKGVDIIIESYKELKQSYDVKLILIGGNPNDELYNHAINSGADVHGYLNRDTELAYYYSAADVAILDISFSDVKLINFAGIGISSIEALGCGTPVVSPALRHFPKHELKYVGIIPKSPKDVTNCIIEILNNPKQYENCRKYVKKYFDWEVVANNILIQYNNLYIKYYNNK